MVQFWYLEEETKYSLPKDWYSLFFLILLFAVLVGLYYGVRYIHGIPRKAETTFTHEIEHKKALADILLKEFEDLVKAYGYNVSSEILRKDFEITFVAEKKESLWVSVKDRTIESKSGMKEETLDLADQVNSIIEKTTKNARSLDDVYQKDFQRHVDESGLRSYLPLLNAGMGLAEFRERYILGSDEYKKKQAKETVKDIW